MEFGKLFQNTERHWVRSPSLKPVEHLKEISGVPLNILTSKKDNRDRPSKSVCAWSLLKGQECLVIANVSFSVSSKWLNSFGRVLLTFPKFFPCFLVYLSVISFPNVYLKSNGILRHTSLENVCLQFVNIWQCSENIFFIIEWDNDDMSMMKF